MTMPTDSEVERIVGEVRGRVDDVKLAKEARSRMMRAMTGEFYDYHIVRVAVEWAARAAIAAMSAHRDAPERRSTPEDDGMMEEDPCKYSHCCCCGPGDTCCDCGGVLLDLPRDVAAERWRDFLDDNPDDLTSPEDLPDHALVTFEQFYEMARSLIPPVVETRPHVLARLDSRREGEA